MDAWRGDGRRLYKSIFFVLLKVLHFFGVAFLIGGVVWYAAVGCHGEWWDVDGGRSDGGPCVFDVGRENLWVSPLAYRNLFGTKCFLVVVIVVVVVVVVVFVSCVFHVLIITGF